MSISAASLAAPSAVPAQPSQGATEELTTVKTQCNKNHWHTEACPHTVTTRPAPKTPEPGRLLDTTA